MWKQRDLGRWFTVLVLWASFGLSMPGKEGELQLWNELMLTEYNARPWRTYTWLETRYRDAASQLGVWMVQQKVYFRLSACWEAGLGGSYLDVKDIHGDWSHQMRFELELNPRWEWGDESVLAFRNRLEVRTFDREGDRKNIVTRHRILFAKSANWFGRMRRFEISNEFFFDTEIGRLSENRFRPLNLFFRIKDRSTINVFAQLRSQRTGGAGDWSNTAVLGFGLRFNR